MVKTYKYPKNARKASVAARAREKEYKSLLKRSRVMPTRDKFGNPLRPTQIKSGKAYITQKTGKIPGYTSSVKTIKSRLKTARDSGKIKKGDYVKVQRRAGVHSFPGTYKGNGIYNNTKGIFVQSHNGMQGKEYIQKAYDLTMLMYFK